MKKLERETGIEPATSRLGEHGNARFIRSPIHHHPAKRTLLLEFERGLRMDELRGLLDSFSLARDVPMFALFVVHIERHWGKDGLPQLRVRDIPPFSIVPEDAVQFI